MQEEERSVHVKVERGQAVREALRLAVYASVHRLVDPVKAQAGVEMWPAIERAMRDYGVESLACKIRETDSFLIDKRVTNKLKLMGLEYRLIKVNG